MMRQSIRPRANKDETTCNLIVIAPSIAVTAVVTPAVGTAAAMGLNTFNDYDSRRSYLTAAVITLRSIGMSESWPPDESV